MLSGADLGVVESPAARGGAADVPDVTPEEHRQRGDAADALFRELKRRAPREGS